jgi:2-haloacid dehalogenase
MDVPSLGLWGQRWDIHGAAVYGDDMDKWVTFDCYGTIADWNSGMLGAIDGSGDLLGAYHREELRLEAGPYRTYREILTEGLRRAGALDAGAFVRAWPSMPVFADAGPALSALASDGWKLAILTNCDDDLFGMTAASFPVPVEVVVTAEQVRSYKPDLGHFRKFAELTGATPANWIHIANSWVHDVLPASRMGLRSVWVDRDHTGHPAKFAERRVTTMRRLPETVADVSALPAWPVP